MYLTGMVAGIDPPQTEEVSDALEHFAHVFSTGATVIHSTRDRGEVNAEVEEAKHLVRRVGEGSRCCASRPAGRRRPHGGWRHGRRRARLGGAPRPSACHAVSRARRSAQRRAHRAARAAAAETARERSVSQTAAAPSSSNPVSSPPGPTSSHPVSSGSFDKFLRELPLIDHYRRIANRVAHIGSFPPGSPAVSGPITPTVVHTPTCGRPAVRVKRVRGHRGRPPGRRRRVAGGDRDGCP